MAIEKMMTIEFSNEEESLKFIDNECLFFDDDNKLKAYCRQKDLKKVEHDFLKEQLNPIIRQPLAGTDNPHVILKHCFFTKPFYDAINDERVKFNYFDVDPTLYFALCFCLLFGLMFGDVGQGAVLVLFGLIARKKNYKIYTFIGLSSIIFGFLYNSFFGNEKIILHFMHQHNLPYCHFALLDPNNTATLMLAVVMVGAILMLVALMLSIYDLCKEGKHLRALLSNNGLAGLLFYGNIIAGAIVNKFWGLNTLKVIILLVIGLFAASMLFSYRYFAKGKDFISCRNYLCHSIVRFANKTMAFVMIGGFALAHANLMNGTYVIASYLPSVKWFIIILGNFIIMSIETTEVYQQCMKLLLHTLYPLINSEAGGHH